MLNSIFDIPSLEQDAMLVPSSRRKKLSLLFAALFPLPWLGANVYFTGTNLYKLLHSKIIAGIIAVVSPGLAYILASSAKSVGIRRLI
jgi:hypothetical protein